jgi:glutamate synthase (NADPH/NADH) large chain
VTNPPIDPIREQLVMSLVSFIGPKPNLLGINEINPPYRLEVAQPVLDFDNMAKLRRIAAYHRQQVPLRRTRHLLSTGLG